MLDICIYDPMSQCFHDCDNCPQSEKDEPDWDLMRDIENERKEDEKYG